MKNDINILGIETSCDETAAAVIKNGREVLSNIISSQIPIHRRFGGVVPEIASRHHVGAILPVIDEALEKAKLTLAGIDGIAVTYGPGLVGALLVGVAAAKGLSFALDKPLIGVNHLQGHVFANFITHKDLEPPFVSLVVSGGHTSLLNMTAYNTFELLGETRDDAAGEAFDKIARVMGLLYPGGPEIEKLALKGNEDAIDFPVASKMDEFSFSFSGLKSSVINYLHNNKQKDADISMADVAASFQKAVIKPLVDNSIKAMNKTGSKKLVLSGGVSANKKLRETLEAEVYKIGGKVYYPALDLCTDNAAMIASRGYYLYKDKMIKNMDLNANPGLSLIDF